MNPRGPRAAGADTRGAILAAARAEFAAKGYDASSLRAIARSASVDPALVHHYFDGKRGLFTEVVALPASPAVIVQAILEGPRAQVGERAARIFLSLWDEPERRERFVALLRSAVSDEAAAQMLREFFSRELLAQIAARLSTDQPMLRASLTAGNLVGIAILRYVLRVEDVARASVEQLVELTGPALQHYLAGADPVEEQ